MPEDQCAHCRKLIVHKTRSWQKYHAKCRPVARRIAAQNRQRKRAALKLEAIEDRMRQVEAMVPYLRERLGYSA